MPGTYPVIIKNGFFMRTVNLVIQDTTAPSASPKPARCPLGRKIEARDLVEDIKDITKVDEALAAVESIVKDML